MKSIKTYPNILWLILNLSFLSFFGMMILVCFEWIFELIGYFKNSQENKIGMIFLLLFITPLFIYYYYQLSNQFIFIKINPNQIVIYQLLKLKVKKINVEEIRGYSKSVMAYGTAPTYNSKSIVIYTENNNQFEIIKIFNLNFSAFENELKKTDIKYLGQESYSTEKMYKRKYKYVK